MLFRGHYWVIEKKHGINTDKPFWCALFYPTYKTRAAARKRCKQLNERT